MLLSDFRRLLAPLAAAAMTVLAVAVVDLLFRVGIGADPAWFPPQLFNGGVDQIGRRVAGAEQLKFAGRIDDAHLAAIIGTSTVEQGFDPQTLTAADPLRRRWLVLAEAGGSLREVEIYGQILLDSDLHPGLVVLGIQPSMIHSEDGWVHDRAPAYAMDDFLHHRFSFALMDCSWLALHHDTLTDATTLAKYRAGRAVQRHLGLSMSAQFAPEADPWSVAARHAGHAPQSTMDAQYAGFQQRFLARQYVDNSRQIAALRRLVDGLRNRGTTVICLLMPESSALRAMQPPVIAAAFNRALEAVGASSGPLRVIDLRAAMPEELFVDYGHMNEAGRQALSEKIPRLVQ